MRKSVFLLLCLTFVGLLSGCSFLGLSVDDAKKNLEEAGYTVKVLEASEYINSDECEFNTLVESELDCYLYAEKGEDKIYMFFFYSTNLAESNYSFMNMNGLRSGMNNKTVYFGTKQAIKDSKI